MYRRKLEAVITEKMFKGKAIIVLGPRQTGKTTLLKQISGRYADDITWLDAEEPLVRNQLTSANISELKKLINNKKILVIDEAQLIKNIGSTLKLIVDHIPEVQVLVSGSSALELAQETNEPLTGRKFEYHLYPFSYEELVDQNGWLEEQRLLEQRLIYGSYPEIVTTNETLQEILNLLAGSYLYKDIFRYKDLRRPELLEKLLQALALQIGSQVSYHELGNTIGADTETVKRYIELLEKTYVIFRLPAFSSNQRNEIKKSRKIYFYDTGIRNAIINNYSPLELRTDKGALWENWLIAERLKFLAYHSFRVNTYFWRTQQQQEVDYIEVADGKISAFEFKWSADKKARLPITFKNIYPDADFNVLNTSDFSKFLMEK